MPESSRNHSSRHRTNVSIEIGAPKRPAAEPISRPPESPPSQRRSLPFALQRRLSRPIGTTFRLLRDAAFLVLDSLCMLVPVRRRDSALVLRLDAVGDFFIWMQSGAAEISEYVRSSGQRAILLGNRAWSDYAAQTGLWDEVIEVEPLRLMRSPVYRLRLLLRIRRLGVRRLIQPRAARVFLQEDAIARVTGAPLRVGNRGTLINSTAFLRSLGDKFYNRIIAVDERKNTHETERNRQFTLELTGRNASPFVFGTPSRVSASETVVIALGAGQIGRVWPVDRVATLIAHIKTRHPSLRIVLLGMPAERSMAANLERRAGGGIENRVGETSLAQFVEAIATSTLTICNDSSAYHIAMAYGRKVLCFLGGGHYGWFAPYPDSHNASARAIVLSTSMDCFWCNWNCKYPRAEGGALRCVASISVDAAVASTERLLANRADTSCR